MVNNIFDEEQEIQSSGNIFDNADDDTVNVSDELQSIDKSQITTYSDEELTDPNKINVNIKDANAPLIVLFGPPGCGKTMTLVRLTRYLNTQGFLVAPIRDFRPAYDTNYTAICDGFDNLVSSDDAAEGTNKINFMLVEVMKNGKRICQLLEAPGEHYFDPEHPSSPFPNYVNQIINRNNRKIWALMVEPNWKEASDRKKYVQKITRLKSRLRPRDKAIVVFNKIDMTNFVMSPGHITTRSAIKEIRDLYPGLIELFKNLNPITSIFKPYNVNFAPFQTGDYSKTAKGKQSFQEGPDEYPRLLWSMIKKLITG